MTALYAASREALAEALWGPVVLPQSARQLADHLVDSGVVRVIDPDDDALVDQLVKAVFGYVKGVEPVQRGFVVTLLRALVEDQP